MIARYYIKHKDLRLLKSGSIIGLINKRKNLKIKYPDSRIIEKKKYKNKIISKIDNRIMVLIPGGNFLFGTNNGEKDEFPQHKKSLPDYYIDKFEVTNHDYSIFLKNTNVTPPRAWKGSTYNPKHKNLPVIVSYKEAEKYAKWAGKKLPTEEEWEKAANGTKHILNKITDKGLIQTLHFTIYPWGNKFNAAFCNSLNFWENKNIGISIKKQYQNGLLPVGTFKKGNSAFNACDMSGNAPEWTTSWYNAYPGNKISNKRYGRQVKVVRGGAWYNSAVKIRITARDYGGLPNLYDDNIAGFRCIKEPGNLDLK